MRRCPTAAPGWISDPRRQHRGGRARHRRRGRRASIDAQGCLVAPPFVDIHFHMDATLSLGLPRLNQSGTLLEGIALWGELKPLLTREAVAERALRYCDLAVVARAARDPQPCRYLRRPAHRGRCAARREAEDRALYRPAARRVPAGRLLPLARAPRRTSNARSTRASTSSAASRISSAPWRTARARSRCCATSRPSAA